MSPGGIFDILCIKMNRQLPNSFACFRNSQDSTDCDTRPFCVLAMSDILLFYWLENEPERQCALTVCSKKLETILEIFFPPTHQHKLIYQSQTDNNFCVKYYFNPNNDHDIVVYRPLIL